VTGDAPSPARVADLSVRDFEERLATGIGVGIGPFAAFLSVDVPQLAAKLHALYRDYPLIDDDNVFSFHARLEQRRSVPGIGRRLVRFSVDGRVPHEDMPFEQALPVLEWGINLVIALRSHSFMMLHSAVVELDDAAMLLPAAPGAGKTTLCAGLTLAGWRLFSDEFGLIRPGTRELIPVPRPLALKNQSIDVIRGFDPEAYIGPKTPGTRKGTVAHLRPPSRSIRLADRPAPARHIVFPRWREGAPSTLTEIPKGDAFMLLATNAFNYDLLGEPGFESVRLLIDGARCLEFEYSDLDNAVPALTDFVRRDDL